MQEDQAPTVPERDKQGAEVRARWAWTEPAVWTERMLSTLETGVKGGVWFSLIDKVWSEKSLAAAWKKVARNRGAAGIDRQSVRQFEAHAESELRRLGKELQEGRYEPQPGKRQWIEKPGSKEKRPLGIPSVRDRVAQAALRQVLEPVFERDFAEHSYGFRPGRGAKEALRRVDGLLKEGRVWVVDADLKGYFDSIPHDRLMDCVRAKVADGRVLELVEKFLKAGVMEELKGWEPTEKGTPQGAVISPLLANLYLDELDHLMAKNGCAMTRYADDFVIQVHSEAEANAALEQIKQWVAERGLELHPEKTRIGNVNQPGGGFEFLGYRFEKSSHWPRAKSLKKVRATVRERTPRCAGRSLKEIIAELNPMLRGWFGYFKHSPRSVMVAMDGYVRRRLRSILRHQRGYAGVRNRSKDSRSWPNAFFTDRGLYSLRAARDQMLQSRHRAIH
jgi:RNA-directed DNA polymerase